ncbi:hypothetical protein PAHAL_9G628000 [Panicum hallii]|uniref:Uncharacterized protein n=1 Tax=Panicum hallii TaxID=206008 RepID=A0A2T8I6M5_9POAL|nr:hypothetical protein PAHAL_9G628000 [Panicum hallii]
MTWQDCRRLLPLPHPSTSDLSEQIPRPANPLPPWQPRNRTRGLRRDKDKARGGLRACRFVSTYSRPPRAASAPGISRPACRHPVNSKLSVRITCPCVTVDPVSPSIHLIDRSGSRSISGRGQRAWRPCRARLHRRDDPVQRRSGFWIRNGFHSPLATKLAWAGRHLAECKDHGCDSKQAALQVMRY